MLLLYAAATWVTSGQNTGPSCWNLCSTCIKKVQLWLKNPSSVSEKLLNIQIFRGVKIRYITVMFLRHTLQGADFFGNSSKSVYFQAIREMSASSGAGKLLANSFAALNSSARLRLAQKPMTMTHLNTTLQNSL
jgi:hypothetical protein